jgi:hypothetical protein
MAGVHALGLEGVAGGAGAAAAAADEGDLDRRIAGGVDGGDDQARQRRGGGDLAEPLAEIAAGDVVGVLVVAVIAAAGVHGGGSLVRGDGDSDQCGVASYPNGRLYLPSWIVPCFLLCVLGVSVAHSSFSMRRARV